MNLPTHYNLFVTPTSILAVHSQSFMNMLRAAKNMSDSIVCYQLRSNDMILCFLVSVFLLHMCSFHGPFSATFFTFLIFLLLVILLFKIASKHTAEVLCSVLACKGCDVVMEKIHDKFLSDISYSAVGHEFICNESTIYSK